MKRLALYSALSDRASENNVLVVEGWSFENPKTKDAKNALNSIGAEGKVLLVVDDGDINAWKSFRNLNNTHVISPTQLNVFDVLSHDMVVFTKENLPTSSADSKSQSVSSIEDQVEES